MAGFFQRHSDVPPPQVLVSTSAHYSWEKGMKALGFGTSNLIRVRVDDHMRMDVGHLGGGAGPLLRGLDPCVSPWSACWARPSSARSDPIHRIVQARHRCRNEMGFDFGIHVDAAWGGYLSSVFRNPDGTLAPREEVAEDFSYFPGETIYEAFRGDGGSRLGDHRPPQAGLCPVRGRSVHLPQPGGRGLHRPGGRLRLRPGWTRRKNAPARSDSTCSGSTSSRESKPGAAAAAVHVTHAVLPLHREGMGKMLKGTIRSCETFWDASGEVAERLSDRVRLVVPFEPDSNLICIALNPVGNRSLAVLNRFGRRVFQRMKVEPERPVQLFGFIGSYTSLACDVLPRTEANRILRELDIDPATWVVVPEDHETESDHLFLLRHTLMNPFLLEGPKGESYIDLYWRFLETSVDEALDELR